MTDTREKFYNLEGGGAGSNVLLLPSSDGMTSTWSPRKLSNTNEPPKSPAKRKLSESRGVNLPDIKLHPETFTLSQTDDNVIETPLPTASPLSRFNLVPFDTRHSPRANERRMREVIDICIYLPDRRGLVFKVEGGRMATADQLLRMVYEHQDITDYEKSDQLFALWMCSPLLEIQLKPHHSPFMIRLQWREILHKFTTATDEERIIDEPLVMIRRNVYMSKRRQMQLVHKGDVEADLLYRDAKECIMNGLYPCPVDTCLQLTAYDMVLSWGPYNSSIHTSHFIRNKMEELLPTNHAASTKKFSLFGLSVATPSCRDFENHLLEAYKNASALAMDELKWDYLIKCMTLPVYGAAFFNGYIERPAAFGSAYSQVIIAISREYLCILEPSKCCALLTVSVEECCWQKIHEPTEAELRLPSFYVHFPYTDDGRNENERRSRLVQIFSKQSVMMDALLNSSLEIRMQEIDMLQDEEEDENETDGQRTLTPDRRLMESDIERGSPQILDNSVYKSKLSRLCAATIDSNGKCLEARGLLKTILHTN